MSDIQSRQGFTPREYTAEEIAGFLRDDQLDEQARVIVKRFSESMDGRAGQSDRAHYSRTLAG